MIQIQSRLDRFVWCALAAWAALAAIPAHAITIDMVTVGNAGNAADMRYNLNQRPEGFGAVPYTYQIGKYEVTAGQYTAFLNAVADDDTYELYNPAMGDPSDSLGCNIQQIGDPGSYTYSVDADWANRPVNYVSFLDAARFANWLHNGQPMGAQGLGTTEDGAYHDFGDSELIGRNMGARFFIPSEDEWYKAAYHDKSAGLAESYFDYPTGTSAVPGNDLREATNPGNNANYYISDYAIGDPYYRKEAGEFELSDSPYGTFDQGGNVWEWNETAIFAGSSRGLRAGSFNNNSSLSLRADSRVIYNPPYGAAYGDELIGLRVASIPEPGSITLVVCGAVAGLI